MRRPVFLPPVHDDLIAAQHDPAVGIGQILGHGIQVHGAPGDESGQKSGNRHLCCQYRPGDLAQQLDIAQRRVLRPAGQVEIIRHQGLLIHRRIAPERVDRQHGAGVVVHEIAPHLIGGIAKAGPQQQHGGLHSPCGQNDNGRSQHLAIHHNPDNPTRGICDQPGDFSPGAQGDVGVFQGGGNSDGFGVHLATVRIGKGVPCGLAALQPLFNIHAQGQGCGVQPHAGQPRPQVGNGGFIGDRGKGVGGGMGRL